MRVTGTCRSNASLLADKLNGIKNSSRSISPGCGVTRRIFQPPGAWKWSLVAACSFVFTSMIIGYLYVVRLIIFPPKADAVLIVDPDAVLSFAIA